MVIVEFCGPPGCGKSTICKKIENEFATRGYKVDNLQISKPRDNIKQKIVGRVTRYYYLYAPFNRQIRKCLAKIPISSPEAVYWKRRILEVAYRIRKAEKSGTEIAFFDEGMMQFITSIYHRCEFDGQEEEIVSVLLNRIYLSRTIFINCSLDINENYRRLVNRGRDNDRFLIGTAEQNMKLLMMKKQHIDFLLSKCEEGMVYELGLGDDKEAVEGITNKISKLLNSK